MIGQDQFVMLLRDIRSFEGLQRVPFRPLTLLVGENSSGKSTLLALLSAMTAGEGYPFEPMFSHAPFSLGGFDSIFASSATRRGKPKEFSLGFEYRNALAEGPDEDAGDGQRFSRSVFATYENWHGRPRLSVLDVDKVSGAKLTARLSYDRDILSEISLAFRADDGEEVRMRRRVALQTAQFRFFGLGSLLYYAIADDSSEGRSVRGRIVKTLGYDVDRLPFRTIALAPIRSRPQRSYSEATDAFDPTGGHVPFLLHRWLLDQPAAREAEALTSELVSYGLESGLLERVRVRQPGRKSDDPYQIQVVLGSRARNIVDVGYGVSQSMPLVVETALATGGEPLLIQQPEVHLHPKAQAALGTFFARAVGTLGRRVIVETHSDYLIDRVRTAIADGVVRRDEVGLIFLERKRTRSRVHNIELDDLGNIVKAPAGYRSFFLGETLRNLSRGAVRDVPNR